MIAVVGIVISAYGLWDRRLKGARFAWVLPLALFLLAMVLTKSRGGFLALLVAGVVFAYFRFGKWITLAAAAVLLPAAFLLGGRMAELGSAMSKGNASGTGGERVQLWSDGLVEMKKSPIFGIGCNRYAEEIGLVAHNSYIHGFVELGLFGGSLFLGAFWFAVQSFWKLDHLLKKQMRFLGSGTFRGLETCVVAAVCGVAVSLLSLSRNYVTPTYIILGTASAYLSEARRQGFPAPLTLTPRRLGELLLVSIGFLLATQAFIKFVLR
jgi:hypothetical protein